MLRVPVLDEEAVREAAADVADDARIGRRGKAGVAPEALEEHVEPRTEVAGSEVVEARLRDDLGDQLLRARVPLVRAHLTAHSTRFT